MATPDFSKIWGKNSPLAPYTFTDDHYLTGWNFVGSTPPARTMFDAWMRGADEKLLWLYENAFSENSLGGFLFWRLPNTAYFVGEKRALQDGPLDIYLECTVAGKTATTDLKKLPAGTDVGNTLKDGGVTWIVRKFVDAKLLDTHRTAAELDHPDGSVKRRHIADEALDNDYMRQSKTVAKNSVDWNTLTKEFFYEIDSTEMAESLHAPVGAYNFGVLLVCRARDDMDIGENRLLQAYYPHQHSEYYTRMRNGNPSKEFGWTPWIRYDSKDSIDAALKNKVSKSGDTMSGNLTVPNVYASEWFRARGDKGFYFEDHGGGWHMTDNDWIRAYNGKHVYTSGRMKADEGFEGRLIGKADAAGHSDTADRANSAGGADNANKLGGQSLPDILNRINAQNTGGIVAGSLEQNGWVKFANGLIVQWGHYGESKDKTDWRRYPIAFPRKVVYLGATSLDQQCAPRWISWFDNVDREKFTLQVGPDYEGKNTLYHYCLFIGY
nr:MAG TPA: shufflon protein [Caudoviricetes sp.]